MNDGLEKVFSCFVLADTAEVRTYFATRVTHLMASNAGKAGSFVEQNPPRFSVASLQCHFVLRHGFCGIDCLAVKGESIFDLVIVRCFGRFQDLKLHVR